MALVTSTDKKPKWHISLSDGTTEYGFRTCDARGNIKPIVNTNPYPQYASQLRQGRSRHADRVPPFLDVALDNFSGGRGELHYDVDTSKYWDARQVDTRFEGRVMLGAQETFTKAVRDFDQRYPSEYIGNGEYGWYTLRSGGNTSAYRNFTASASYNVNGIVFWLRKVGSPTGNITVSLYDDSAGNPNVQLKSKAIAVGTALEDLDVEKVYFEFSSVQAITSGTKYYAHISYSGGDADNYIQVAYDAVTPPTGETNLHFRVIDDTDNFNALFFTYRGLTYFVTQPDDHSASSVYMNGDRGVADSNSGALTTVVDATKSWTTNEWAGDVVYIINGPGSNEEQPYRTISSNTATTLTVSDAWNITHTTDTEYIIISESTFTAVSITNLTQYCTDVAVTGRFVYFAQGTDAKICRFEAYNNGGTYTERDALESYVKGDRLVAYNDPSPKGGERLSYLGISQSYSKDYKTARGSLVLTYRVPMFWGDLYNTLGVVFPTDQPWDFAVNTGVTSTLHSGDVDPDIILTGGVTKIALDASAGTGYTARHFTEKPFKDLRNGGGLLFAIYPSENSWAATPTLSLELNKVENDYDLPALTADQWNWCNIDLKTTGNQASADEDKVGKISLYVHTDQGAENFYFWPHGIQLRDDRLQAFHLPYYSNVNSMIEYAGGEGQTEKKVWCFTDQGVFHEEMGNFTELYLRELAELKHPRNGEGVTVNDSYVYFNVGESIQRYYAGTLDNVGPDIGYGLPEDRRGIPGSMASYPGHVFAAIDAGDNYSSILVRRNHGWHEVYRGREGKRIRNIHVQGISGQPDRMWFVEGADIVWIPIALNPETEDGYYHVGYGSLTTGRIYGGLRETQKYFNDIEIISENLTSDITIEVDYKASGDTSWTYLGVANTSPNDTITFPSDTTGRYIQLRFRMFTNDPSVTPVMVTCVLNMLERVESNSAYTYNVLLPSDDDFDLLGNSDTEGATKWAQILTWVDDADTLTLRSASAFEDNKTVFIEPAKTRMLKQMLDGKHEQRIMQLTLIEK